ncbi:hypothetical protein [Wenxinia marina]|uniref:Secreted protein n=1 Tax=Wenxinia marina DSM 24838 TaxID=1123501 RepID=A0A0D0PCX0_9RHOB|nr:hypothetical protein [Wenxinia marina]KIQ69266.1 hypothetical protein Wenmar_02337 [Wenxinia marina DSM 24838]GGL71660.1 hypothetical protein GCM10011392_27840 [Wenxinia marina]
MNGLLRTVLLAGAVAAGAASPGAAQSGDSASAPVEIMVVPYASLQFVGTPLLSLSVPPPGSTIPSSGVLFDVIGNATATLQAEPDSFLTVPNEGFMGRAISGGNSIGYKVELRYPRTGLPGSPVGYAGLPGFEEGPTVPALSVDLTATGGMRRGEIHMEAHPAWTVDGGLALPGLYEGQIILTLSAS